MHKRIIVLLRIQEEYYKFLSILYSQKDASYFLYSHLIDEKSPFLIAEPFRLLKIAGNFSTGKLKKTTIDNGQQVHLSIHPLRIYLKKRSINGKEEHLIDEYEPQPFNREGFRLHCFFTPAAKDFLPKHKLTVRKDEELVIFEWESLLCPQVNLYELSSNFDIHRVHKILPEGADIRIIQADKLHPAIALHLRATNGDPGVWRSNCYIFGKVLKKKPISKSELQRIIDYNEANFDISSLPENAIIHDYKIEE
jgi:hypothetical protein